MAHPAAPAHSAEPSSHAEEHHGSYMPLVLTVGATIFLLGLLKPALAVVGFLIMAGAIIGWIREDVHELSHKPYTPHGSEYLMGSVILILSEVVLFGILFTFYFWSRSHTADFLPDVIVHMDMVPIYLNTALLIASGVTVELAKWRLKKDHLRGFQMWMGATILLGVAFVIGQILEYQHLIHEGLTPQSSVYGTAFFSLTGVHGLHVVAGIIVLALLTALSFTGFVNKERLSGMEGAFLYWHFVDLVWVLVFSFVYLRVI